MCQVHRNRAGRAFRAKKARVLVATNVASRGLDIAGATTCSSRREASAPLQSPFFFVQARKDHSQTSKTFSPFPAKPWNSPWRKEALAICDEFLPEQTEHRKEDQGSNVTRPKGKEKNRWRRRWHLKRMGEQQSKMAIACPTSLLSFVFADFCR